MMVDLIEIRELGLPELEPYTHLNESQLKHYYEPEPGIFIAESPNAILRALAAGYEPLSVLMERRYLSTEGAAILEALGGVSETAADRESADGIGSPAVSDSVPEFAGPAAADPVPDSVSSEAVNPVPGTIGAVIPVYVSTLDVLCSITGYHLTRGILAAFRRKTLPSVEDVCRDARRIAVLENIENPTNVGAIIRSAAALGMDAVLLTPQCADPLQRRAIRVSVGTVFQVPWTWIGLPERYFPWMKKREIRRQTGTEAEIKWEQVGHASVLPSWPDVGVAQLRRLGFRIASMALDERAICIDDPALISEEKLALILGNEGDGLLPQTIALSDDVVTIPMQAGVDSLNVAAASAVAFWQLRERQF